jgi:hypothetical protein
MFVSDLLGPQGLSSFGCSPYLYADIEKIFFMPGFIDEMVGRYAYCGIFTYCPTVPTYRTWLQKTMFANLGIRISVKKLNFYVRIRSRRC